MIHSFDRPIEKSRLGNPRPYLSNRGNPFLGLARTTFAISTVVTTFAFASKVDAQELRPIKVDTTASLVRLAPRIIVCDPIPVSYQEETISESLPAPSLERPPATGSADPITVEVEVEMLDGANEAAGPSTLLPPPSPMVPASPLNRAQESLGTQREPSVKPLANGMESLGSLDSRALRQPDSRGWLDIRPREIEGAPTIVPVDQLPKDTSGLAPEVSVPNLVQYPHVDLLMRDMWAGATFCHRPLYFEDSRLERYGCIAGPLNRWPSVHSAIHFGWKAGVLPLSMAIDRPWSCVQSGCKTDPLSRWFRSPF